MATESYGPSALFTPANALTMTRVMAMPVLLVLILGDGPSWAAFAVWVVVAMTDIADGMVARRQGTTRSGAFLDPLADKVLVLGVMYALVAQNRLWWLPVTVIALREVLLSGYRSYVGRRGISVPARPLAKLKTVAQDLAVGLALVPFTSDGHLLAMSSFLWVAVVLTVVTGAQYLWDGRRVATGAPSPG
ncbi:MAG: CDP-alcohol phosphatidyltransferase family protein [Actinomycetota bacterium]|nr:CDP-alcohol phosphatidyltransferase family protein [Actinomycetota bacterium]